MAGDAVTLELDGQEVRLSSPGRVLFAERGETKRDLVRYYERVATPLARDMGGRPVLLQRFPKGAGGPSFFQKRIPDSAPAWLRTTTVSTVNGTPSRALVAADLAHVAWAVNLGCLGFHVWPFQAAEPAYADELRLDLDPQPGTGFDDVRTAAFELRALLEELGVAGHPKTTGNRGLHVHVRLEPRWDSYAVRSAAVAVARELERRRPDLLTAAWWKEERGERIFVDFNQNAPHKTVFGAWSVRARPGGQVSCPLRWDELGDVASRRADDRDRPGPPRRARRPVGRDRHGAAVARAAPGPARARPGGGAAGCAVAARLPEDARRAAARRAEPRAQAGLTHGSALARLEHHHRDLAVGLGLERVVGRPGRGHDAPQLGLLRGRGDPCPRGVVVGLDLHGHGRIALEVEEPAGRRAAAVGGHHHVVVSVALIDQRRGPLRARAAPGGGEQQHRGALPVVTVLAVGLAVAVDVLRSEQRDAHQPTFSASSTMIPAGPRT